MRVCNDEQSGLGEAVLAGAVSRWRWLLTAVAAALLGSTVLMFFARSGQRPRRGHHRRRARNRLAVDACRPRLRARDGGDRRKSRRWAVALRRPWIGWLAVTFVVTSLVPGRPAATAAMAPGHVAGRPDQGADGVFGHRAGGHGRRSGRPRPHRRRDLSPSATQSEESKEES